MRKFFARLLVPKGLGQLATGFNPWKRVSQRRKVPEGRWNGWRWNVVPSGLKRMCRHQFHGLKPVAIRLRHSVAAKKAQLQKAPVRDTVLGAPIVTSELVSLAGAF